MARISAGLLLWRRSSEPTANIEVLIVHPGGPFWARKQQGAWSILKGEFDPDSEDAREAARREFAEELGTAPPPEPWLDIGDTKLKSGKRIVAFAAAGDLDVEAIESNTFELEWPRGSGTMIDIAEVDEARWVDPATAQELLNPAQSVFVDRLIAAVATP